MKALYVMQQDMESRWVLNNYDFMLAEIQLFIFVKNFIIHLKPPVYFHIPQERNEPQWTREETAWREEKPNRLW
jgi:hypothetical protein